ncbi:YgaP family membrane protein [Ferdinandcohnia quinoae]|uniref:DUF2892 domain-containing protein n=1 Tax=Fredinandcohnia quinoae TaxID=2918902 RepID=A0AAW5DX95_9BACI|nr:DUF2892 domain-containing protein [Fredinandcohnia sp. SECRCQ15]MCH1624673.1 DUF2892 domain-containing protein [Fredinandcohnia sp. SECRCQ15]
MKPNIGAINALLRITCGLTMLAWTTSKLTRRPWCGGRYLFIAILAAMKVGEGITRFCPITALFEQRANEKQENAEELLPAVINPT